MADNTTVWTFEQIEGARKKFILSDHCAPHGRPRKGAVVEKEIEQRVDSVYYAGNTRPTRHMFGTTEGDSRVIKGRFSDSRGGKGFARNKKAELEAFIRDGHYCLVTWDDLISEICLPKRCKLGIESGGEMTYEIEYLVDADHTNGALFTQGKVIKPRSAQNIMGDINAAVADMGKLTEVPAMRGSIFDSISSLIAIVATASSALNSVAAGIDSFANAPFQLMNQLHAALDQFRTAVTSLRKTYDDLQNNIALESDNIKNQQAFWDVKSAWAVSSLDMIRLAIEMDRAAALAQQGSIQAIYVAREGDTWEQVSRVAYNGSPERASEIREANGVPPGQAPVPGTEYMVPT